MGILRSVRSASLASLLFASTALAQDPVPNPLTLTWHAPEPCPSEVQLRERIRGFIGKEELHGKRVTAEGRVWRGEDGQWHVTLHTWNARGAGKREIEGDSCDALTEATALILAMAIDPEAVAARTGNVAPDVEEPISEIAPKPILLPANAGSSPPLPLPVTVGPSNEAPITPYRGLVAPLVGVDVGSLPSASAVIGMAAGVLKDPWRLEAFGWWWFEQDDVLASRPLAGGDFDLFVVGVQGCGDVVGGSLRLGICLSTEIGRMDATGFGVTDPGSADPLWFAVSPGLLGTWAFTDHLGLRIQAGMVVPVARPRFMMNPYGTVHRAAPVMFRGSFGPEIRFP